MQKPGKVSSMKNDSLSISSKGDKIECSMRRVFTRCSVSSVNDWSPAKGDCSETLNAVLFPFAEVKGRSNPVDGLEESFTSAAVNE